MSAAAKQPKQPEPRCGYEDPFGGPCVLPKGHEPRRRHDDGRVRR